MGVFADDMTISSNLLPWLSIHIQSPELTLLTMQVPCRSHGPRPASPAGVLQDDPGNLAARNAVGETPWTRLNMREK